jgi:hypothetical protein
VIAPSFGSNEGCFGNEKRSWYAAPLGVVLFHKRKDWYMVGSAGSEASQRCKNDSMAECDVAEFNRLEESRSGTRRHVWCFGVIGCDIVLQPIAFL